MDDPSGSRRQNNATRMIASTAGAMCGISGLEHGFFETLQGNARPDALLISAIGPANRFWPGGTETAFTVLPTFLLAGILAMFFSTLVIIWSAAFIHRKHGALVFLLLSIAQFLAGGGFAQILLVPIIAAGASQINRSLNWHRRLLPVGARRAFAPTWPFFLAAFALAFAAAIFAAIFGWIPIVSPLLDLQGASLSAFLMTLGYCMFGLLPLTFLAGFAHDTIASELLRPVTTSG